MIYELFVTIIAFLEFGDLIHDLLLFYHVCVVLRMLGCQLVLKQLLAS